jgi:hypothetical protein
VQELESQIEELATLDSTARDSRLTELVLQLRQRQSDNHARQSMELSPSPAEHDRPALHDEISFDGGAIDSLDVEGRVSLSPAVSLKIR